MQVPDELLEPLKWVGAIVGAFLGYKGYLRVRRDGRIELENKTDHVAREEMVEMLRRENARLSKIAADLGDKLDAAVAKRWDAEAKVNALNVEKNRLEGRNQELEREAAAARELLQGFYDRGGKLR
jgi:chromosome segregation ATPase